MYIKSLNLIKSLLILLFDLNTIRLTANRWEREFDINKDDIRLDRDSACIPLFVRNIWWRSCVSDILSEADPYWCRFWSRHYYKNKVFNYTPIRLTHKSNIGHTFCALVCAPLWIFNCTPLCLTRKSDIKHTFCALVCAPHDRRLFGRRKK